MADNIAIPATGSGDATPTVRTKDRTGVETQIVALDLDPAGAETLMAGSMPVTGTVTVQDGGGSITVDGSVTVDSELTTADLDTGAGTDTRAVVGLAGAASGGAVLVQATSAGAMKNDITTIAGTAPTTVGKLDVKVAAGDDVTVGNTTDAAVVTDTTGTLSGKLRGLVKWAFERMPAALGQTTMAASLPVTLASNQSALPVTDNSGSLTVDSVATAANVAAYHATDSIMAAGAALTPKYAFANVAASQTDSNIVTAVGGKKIRVLSAYAVAGATATDLTFNSKPAGAGSAKSAKFANGANGGEILPFSPAGWFETVSGEGLTVTTGAGSTTGIGVVYIEV